MFPVLVLCRPLTKMFTFWGHSKRKSLNETWRVQFHSRCSEHFCRVCHRGKVSELFRAMSFCIFKPCSHVTKFSLIFQPEIPFKLFCKRIAFCTKWVVDPFAVKFYSLVHKNFVENFRLMKYWVKFNYVWTMLRFLLFWTLVVRPSW